MRSLPGAGREARASGTASELDGWEINARLGSGRAGPRRLLNRPRGRAPQRPPARAFRPAPTRNVRLSRGPDIDQMEP